MAAAAQDGEGRVFGESRIGFGLATVVEERTPIAAVLLQVPAARAKPHPGFLRLLDGVHADRYIMSPMSCLGIHFALTDADGLRLLAAGDNDAVMTIIEEIEEVWDEAWLVQTDQSWDALHRCLSNGTIYYDEGDYPLNRTVLGGKHLYDGDDYVVSYVAPNEVKDVAAALAALTEKELRARYDGIDPDEYNGEHGEADFKDTWGKFLGVREFYRKAAAEGRAVVFTVDP